MFWSAARVLFTEMHVHVFFVTQDYVSVFYQDADNAEASVADDQTAEEQGTGTGSTDVTTDVEEEGDDDDDDFEDEDDIDEGLQQAIESSILMLEAKDQGAAPPIQISTPKVCK